MSQQPTKNDIIIHYVEPVVRSYLVKWHANLIADILADRLPTRRFCKILNVLGANRSNFIYKKYFKN
jgi:hypothetical protein